MKFKLVVEIEGEESSDLVQALDEVRRLVDAGYQSGMDSNDTGEFTFTVTEEESYEKE